MQAAATRRPEASVAWSRLSIEAGAALLSFRFVCPRGPSLPRPSKPLAHTPPRPHDRAPRRPLHTHRAARARRRRRRARRPPEVAPAQKLSESAPRESTAPSQPVSSLALLSPVSEESVDVAPSPHLVAVEWVLAPYKYRALLTLLGDRGSARVEYHEGTVVQGLRSGELAFTFACDVVADVCSPLRVLSSDPTSSLLQ